MIKKWLIFFCCWSPFFAFAHQADVSSTLLVEQEDNQWLLQIRASLTAFEYEIKTHYGATSFKTPEEFKELVIDHLGKNILIQFNEAESNTLNNLSVKLGHETLVTFKLSQVPQNINSLFLKNTSFKDIHKNQSGLMVLKKGFIKKQFVLSEKNKHQVQLKVNESKNQFILSNEEVALQNKEHLLSHDSSSIKSYVIASLLFGFVLFFFLFYSFKRRKST